MNDTDWLTALTLRKATIACSPLEAIMTAAAGQRVVRCTINSGSTAVPLIWGDVGHSNRKRPAAGWLCSIAIPANGWHVMAVASVPLNHGNRHAAVPHRAPSVVLQLALVVSTHPANSMSAEGEHHR